MSCGGKPDRRSWQADAVVVCPGHARGSTPGSGGFGENRKPAFGIEKLDPERSLARSLAGTASRRGDRAEMARLAPEVDLGGRRTSERLVRPEKGVVEESGFEVLLELHTDEGWKGSDVEKFLQGSPEVREGRRSRADRWPRISDGFEDNGIRRETRRRRTEVPGR